SPPQRAIETSFSGDIRKGAVAVIEKQADAAKLRDEHVGPTVVVDVADGHAHAMAGDIQAAAGADVVKSPVGFLLKQPVRGAGVGSAVLQQQDVETTVVIEIEAGSAGTDDLRQKVAAVHRPRIMDEIEPGLGSNLLEPGGSRRLGLLRHG